MTDAKTEAIQAVVDRVSSYQDGATESTVASELTKALGEAGLELADGDVDKLVTAIEAQPDGDGAIHVDQVLGDD